MLGSHVYLLCLVPLLTVIIQHGTEATPVLERNHYGVLIDAGSTSSKVKIYKWRKPQSVMQPPHVELTDSTKIRPPVASYLDNTDGLVGYLAKAIDWAKKVIPSSEHRSTSIQVLATAGMRYLAAEDTQRLLSAVRNVLRDHRKNPFMTPEDDDVSVLSGEEEGVYAWLAANYLLGFFDGNKPNHESAGIMEMGGGSTQIAFIPEGPLYDGEFQIRMAGKRYSVYVHSYLHFGARAIKSEIAYYLETRASINAVTDPCRFRGFNDRITLGDGTVVSVQGGGSAKSCQDVISNIIRPETGIYCQPKPCAVRNIYQPSIGNVTFYAMGNFGHAPKTLNSIRSDGTLDIKMLTKKSGTFCKLNLAQAQSQYPKVKKYVSDYCTMANYIPLLLKNYGFQQDTRQIKIAKAIKSLKIDWAMGAMLAKLTDKFYSGSVSTVTSPSKDATGTKLPFTTNNPFVDIIG